MTLKRKIRLHYVMSSRLRNSFKLRIRLAALGADPSCMTPPEFAELVAADLKRWAEAVAIAGIKQQ
jgi:tripartite-type tricarboxylate transporter receptor subunit TctC